MKIGFGTHLWLSDNHFENFYRMLDELSLIGFDGFETYQSYLMDWYENRPGELKRLLKMHDIELADYYTGISFVNVDKCRMGVEEVKRRCRFVAELNGQFVLLDGGEKNFGSEFKDVDDYIKFIAGIANQLGEYARSLGIILAWHQHWGSIFETPTTFDRLMQFTEPDLVGFCPDVGQLTLCGFDVIETIKRYLNRIKFIHYKDVSYTNCPKSELWEGGIKVPSDEGAYNIDSKWRWVELGRGVVPFREITQILQEAGYDGWIVDDLDYSGYPAYASAKACKDFINNGLGIWGERKVI